MQIDKIQTTKIYKKLAIIFSILAVIILGCIIYFSFSKTIITVSLFPNKISTNFMIDIKGELTEEERVSDDKLTGYFLSTDLSDSQNFVNFSQGEQVEAQATGTVTIYNNWTQEQPLAATTRLLTPEGILFRIKERVDVPAGGKIENIEVYADQVGASGNIEPTTFTIPGLWEGLQDKIYAESSEPMTGGLREASVINQQIIEETENQLKEKIIEKAKKEFSKTEEVKNSRFQTLGQAIATIILEKESSASVGEQVDSFEVSMNLRVMTVIFDESELLNLALNKLKEELPDDEKIHETSNKTLSYSVEEYSYENQTASLNVELIAAAVAQSSSSIFNKDNLTNKNSQEINAYFSNFDEILSVEINFSPFWATKTSNLKDHIELKIEE